VCVQVLEPTTFHVIIFIHTHFYSAVVKLPSDIACDYRGRMRFWNAIFAVSKVTFKRYPRSRDNKPLEHPKVVELR